MAINSKKRKLSGNNTNEFDKIGNCSDEDEESNDIDNNVKTKDTGSAIKIKKQKVEKEAKSTNKDETTGHEQNQVDQEGHYYETYANEVKNIKYSSDFKMLKFREKLRGNDFIPELRHFLYLAENKPQIINKYFQKRGKPLELVESLERVDKSHLYHISYVCHALQKILMEILVNEKSHTVNAVNASRFFLRNHGQVIERLLKSPIIAHRQIILKLLTAMVCLEPQLGRQLLSSFDVLSNVQLISTLLSHSDAELNKTETVRKCFIHFILSYFIDGNALLIRNIMDKTNLIKSLIFGLNYDDHVTVCMILNTLQKYVIENPDVTKTKKINVFDFVLIKKLLSLYDWKGPDYFISKQKNKNSVFDENSSVYIASKEPVRETVHKFLITLLSSRKFGIAFDAITNFKLKHNTLQGKVIKSVLKPWLDELKIDLITKILIACPELGKTTIKHYANCLNPFKITEKFWIQTAIFIGKLIMVLHPSLLKITKNDISLTEITYWIKNVCLSSNILIYLKSKDSLKSKNANTRVATTRLLFQMYAQHCNYMKAVLSRDENKGNELRRFKFDILNHIYVNFPTIENILHSLYESIQDEDKENNMGLEHLGITIDLILLMAENNRSFINKTGIIIDYIEMLQPLYIKGKDVNIDLELKAVKTILLLMPNALKPQEKLFANVLTSFLRIFTTSIGAAQIEAGDLLKEIFFNTGFFENGKLEIDLWLEATRYVDTETIKILSLVFIECFQSNAKLIESNTEKLIVDNNFCQQLFENIENKKITEGYIETPAMSKLFLLITEKVTISKKLEYYLEIVSLLLFHYIPNSDIFTKTYFAVDGLGEHKEYMENWVLNQECSQLPKSQMLYNFEELYKSILSGKNNFIELFKTKENCSSYVINGTEVSLSNNLTNNKLILIYINLICFILSKLVKNLKLEAQIAKSAAQYLSSFLLILHQEKDSSTKENEKFLEVVLKYVYCNQVELIYHFDFFENSDSKQNYINFLSEIIEVTSKFQLSYFDELTIIFRLKLINQIQSSIKNTISLKNTPKSLNGIKFMDNIKLTREDCVDVLKSLVTLQTTCFIDKIEKSIYFDLLMLCLNRLAELKISIVDKEMSTRIANLYIGFSNIELNTYLDKFNESLINFFTVSHQLIVCLPTKFFESFFETTKTTKSTIKLAILLFERSSIFDKIFNEKILEHSPKKELIYPLLNIAYSKKLNIDRNVTQHIYQEYKAGFIKTIEKPQKIGVTYKENVEATVHLINEHMPPSECIDFTRKNLRPDSVEVFQLKVINAIYKKAILSGNEEQYKQIFVNYISNLVNFYDKIIARRDYIDSTIKLDLLNFYAFEWFEKFQEKHEYDFQQLLKSQLWSNVCKNILKIGMQKYENTETHLDCNAAKFLKILAYLCSKLYTNVDNDQDVVKIFEMIMSHSKYFDIIHVKRPTYIKTEIFHLSFILAQKNLEILKDNHIPIYLSAYQAKMSVCDQYILALIKFYEENGINLHSYRPFLWGDAAIDCYAVTSDDMVNLQQQEPSTLQVMSLIDKQISDFTIQNYPIWRKLNVLEQLPETNFENPLLMPTEKNGDKLIADEQKELNENGLKISPINDEFISKCYDPAFIISLTIMCFAPEMYSQPVRPVQNGLLGMVFAALSSQDKSMRLAAGCCQHRYRQHFENGKFFEKALWSQIYDNIQNGLGDLQSNTRNGQSYLVPKISYISGLFLAHSMNIFIDPTNVLYKPLIMYLRLKENFDFQCVPAFNIMFHNPETEHVQFRQFILQIINDGIKCNTDVILMITTNSFKAIMGFYGSSMSSLEINLLILSIIYSSIKIPSTVKQMIEQVGVLPWLNSVIEEIEYFYFDTIEIVIKILSSLWHSIELRKNNFYNYNHIQLNIFNLILKLSPYISGRISLDTFTSYLNILEKTSGNYNSSLKEENLDRILNCASRHFPEHIWKILNLRNYGTEGMESKDQFCKNLQESDADTVQIMALNSLREILAKKFN